MRAGIITSSALVFLGLLAGVPAAAASNNNKLVSLLDPSSASLRLSAIPSDKTTEGGLVSIIASPGTASYLTTTFNDDSSSSSVLAWNAQDATLLCRGATLSDSTSTTTAQALATTSVVASSLILDGITGGDAQHLSESRHASTLTALFRAKLTTVSNNNNHKQTLILVLSSSIDSNNQEDELKRQLQSLLEATAVDCGTATTPSLDDLYDVVIQSVTSAAEAKEVSL